MSKGKIKKKSYPRLYIKELRFKDGVKLSLKENSIVVFVGANNCGKSQMLLDIETSIKSDEELIIVDSTKLKLKGDIDYPPFLKKNFKKHENGSVTLFNAGVSYELTYLTDSWKSKDMYSYIPELFVKRITTEERLSISNSCKREERYMKEPFYILHDNDKKMDEISDLFFQAFGEELILNKGNVLELSLHVGKGPKKSDYTISNIDKYWDEVSKLPQLQHQGDGMRSFASLLIDAFTSDYSITLLDEPEAFLHPPQARLLGKMLVERNSNHRQLFISTHSEEFLKGILDANSDKVTIVRIDRNESINFISVLSQESIKVLWNNPIMRYSNILSGVFHDKVVICESDYDCLFYNAVLEAICESKKMFPPDILFTHCGGNKRIKDIVGPLKIVGTQVAAICDFDTILSSNSFKELSNSFGIEWNSLLFPNMKIIYDEINSKGRAPYEEKLKRIGKSALTGDAPKAYEIIEGVCKSEGLFVVPVGEMESFDHTINKLKKEWVYSVLATYDFASEPKLACVREFVNQIIEWKQSNRRNLRVVSVFDKDINRRGVG